MRRDTLILIVLLASTSACGGGEDGGSASPSPTGGANPVGDFTVTVDDRTLSGECRGRVVAGQPTFVLESGQGNDSGQLQQIFEALARVGLVCSYDRAGLGSSDPVDHAPRRLSELLADLHSVLAEAHVPKPYLLVGHSLGAMMVLLYAQRYPDEVAGVVSMNPGPTFHDWLRRLKPIVTRQELRDNEIAPLTGDVPGEPVDVRSSDILLEEPFPQRIPYTIMFAEDCAGGTDPYCNKVVGQLEDTQRALAELSPNGRFVGVRGAGHEIYLSDMDQVIAAINDVLARSR